MTLQSTAIAVGLAALLGACGAASQPRAQTQIAGPQCASLSNVDRQVAELYGAGKVERVEPLYRVKHYARAIQHKYVAGAKLYIPAEHGVHEPYLERVLTCHAASQDNIHPNDPLRVDHIQSVSVAAAGPRFVVTIASDDSKSGKEILQRARALRDGSTQVDVKQLSALPVTPAL